MKMNKIVFMATTAMTAMLSAAPITAFAQSNATEEVVVEAKAVEENVTENEDSETQVTSEEKDLPYSYSISEDGTIVFSFDGEEYVYEEEEPSGTVVTNGSRLNVRTGAGMDYDVIDQLCPGEEVSVIGTEGDWYQITVPAKTGYVHGDYLEVLENATNETDAALLQMFMMMFMDILNEDTSNALTPDGNMNLIDDYGSATDSGKQFITLTTKNGNYFYLIIDRDDNGAETVHFLNLVDESDLLSLMEEEEVEAYRAASSVEVEEPTTEAEPTEEVVEEKAQTGAFNPMLLVPLLIVLAGGGIVLFLKMKKNKEEQEVKPDPDADYEDESMRAFMEEDDFLDELPEDDDMEDGEED